MLVVVVVVVVALELRSFGFGFRAGREATRVNKLLLLLLLGKGGRGRRERIAREREGRKRERERKRKGIDIARDSDQWRSKRGTRKIEKSHLYGVWNRAPETPPSLNCFCVKPSRSAKRRVRRDARRVRRDFCEESEIDREKKRAESTPLA